MIDLTRIPYPVASLYREMQQELQPGVRFRSLVRAFSGFLKFVSLISISEYLLGGYEDAAVDELLSGPKLKRPSLGHWNEFLREILQFHIRNGSEPRVLGLLDFYFAGDRRKPSSNVAAIERFITLRNEYVHPDIWPSETTASRLYEENISLLDGLYRNAGFLTEYRFFFQQGGKRLLCHGPDLTAFQQGRSQQGDPEGFFLEKEGEAPLAFMAFLLFDEAEDSADATETLSKDIMLYESRTAKWIKYLRGNNLRYRHEDAFIPTNEVLSRLTKRLAQNDASAAWLLPAEQLRKPRWEDFHKHCKVAALRLVGFHITEKKYNPSFYVARGSIESAFDTFLNGDEPLCLLVGNSGAGKTNLLCHLTMELVASGHAVLHYYGRNYDGGPLLSAIAADLVSDEKDLLPYLAGLNGSSETAGGKKMVLFFDAINEYTDALSLFHNIVELEQRLSAETGIEFHKIVLSMRSATFETIERSFNFTRDKFFFTLAAGESGERARILAGPFTDGETRHAYEAYAIAPNDDSRKRKQKSDFGVRLATPYDALPASIRMLVSNPIFLRYLVTSYEDVTQELTEGDVLSHFYDRNIPARHRYFLHYFLELLWFLRRDFLSEDDLHIHPPSSQREVRRSLAKLLEYCYEDPVHSSELRYVCFNNDPFTNTPCRNYGLDLTSSQNDSGKCKACGYPLTPRTETVRSTFFFMVDEGILTNYQAPGETMLLRFTHDRFFEIMMARHLMHVLARDGFSGIPAAHLLAQWLAELSEVPIYLDVMAWMLSMVQRHRVILDRGNSAASAPEEGPNDGVLYRFEAVPPDEKYEDLMLDIAGRDEPRFRLVMHRALVLAGRDPKGAVQVQDIVLKLSRKTMEKGLDPSRLLALGQLSLGIATELGLRKPFHNLGVHPADKVRALTVAYAYYFWKKDHKAGLALLSEMEQGIYGPLSIPKPKNLEYFVGLCVLLLFRHPTDTETTSHILGLLRSLLKKSGVWIKAAGLALPPLLQSVLKDIPSDYNPVNLEELRRGKKDLADRPQLRQVLSEYARFLRADAVDVQRQREIVSTIQRLSPNNNLCYCIHQLVQAFRASYDLNGAVLSETEFAMTADPEHHMWIQAPLYTTLWLTSGEARLDDETFLAIEKLWAKNIETGNFAYAALVPGSAYHNWNIYYAAFTLMKQRGGPHLPEVRILFDRLLANTDQRGIVAFFRGLDIVGAELSSLYPDTLRLVHATVTDLSDTGRPLPQFALERIAATLERIRALSYDEVESVLDSIRDREARERLRRQMAVQRSDKNATRLNIGTLASVGGQDFYLRAMADRDLRLLFADLMDLLVNARSLGKFVSKAISRLRSALAAQ